MQADQARFLVDNPLAAERATLSLERGIPLLTLRKMLEREHDPDQCRALLDCAQARLRFAQKLERAHLWLLTGTAAEQASPWPVAHWRAERLSLLRPASTVVEFGCGIGGDTVFLTRKLTVRALERCPARALLCSYNVETLGCRDRFTLEGSTRELEALEGEVLYCDPARRSHQRLSSFHEWEPPLPRVLSLISTGRFAIVAVKCAPGLDLDLPPLADLRFEASFISVNGELKECFLIAGSGSSAKRAVMLSSEGGAPITLESSGIEIPPAAPRSGLYLHNPDPAVLRAKALDTLAVGLKAGQPHRKIGYLIGPTPCPDQRAQSFLIEDSFPLKWSHLKKRMSQSGWSEFEYLGRGVPFSQEEVRAKLPRLKRGKGAVHRGTIVVYREDQGYRVIMARRVGKETEPRPQTLPS